MQRVGGLVEREVRRRRQMARVVELNLLVGAGVGGYQTGTLSGAGVGASLGTALRLGAKQARAAVNQQVMQRVGEMLMSRDPSVIARGQRLLARSDGMMNALRHVDTLVAKVTGAESGTNLPSLAVPQ